MVDYTLLMKFGAAFAIALICFIGGIIPIRLTAYFSSPKTLSFANCLSAGILLGAALVHLLFDAEYKQFDYPFAHLCCAVGFFIAFILEKIVFGHNHDHGAGGGEHGHDKKKKKKKKPKKEKQAEDMQRLVFSESAEQEQDVALEDLQLKIPVTKSESAEFNEISPRPSAYKPEADHHNIANGKQEEMSASEEISATEETVFKINLDEKPKPVEKHLEKDSHHHGAEPKKGLWRRMVTSPHSAAYILMAVLGLESAISGSALGIADKSLSVIVVMIAIITHIWAESFALVAAFLKSKMEIKKIYKLLSIFCAITPLGIFLGMALQKVLEGEIAILISSLLISFAAGTFLYIAIVEVIAEEFENGEDKWKKLNLLLLGFAFMAGLAAFI
eukprot:TRINITY_DN3238_c0_g1_i1.p1 TRINITY_DN3238_c0_g1~~TRINITY_DN3238_c0_g1_i1.p1  ORF type:complete len:388 (-),score=94.81 TRINITY_DN3238_c0_g1_i1:327-1490(-)